MLNYNIPTLFNSQVSIDRGISSSSGQIFSLPVRNMLPIPHDVSLSQSKIKNKYFVGSFVQPNAEIIRFDIPVDEVPVMDVLDPGNHLVDQHKDSLEWKFSQSLIEQRFEGRSHQIHNQHIVITWIRMNATFSRAIVDVGDALVNNSGVVV